MNGLSIRLTKEEDWERIKTIFRASLEAHYLQDLSKAEQALEDQRGYAQTLVAVKNRKVIGYCMGFSLQNDRETAKQIKIDVSCSLVKPRDDLVKFFYCSSKKSW